MPWPGRPPAPSRPRVASPAPRSSWPCGCRSCRALRCGVDNTRHGVRLPFRGGVALDQARSQLQVLVEEPGPGRGVGEAHGRLNRRARDLGAVERRPVEQRRRVPLEPLAHIDEMMQRDLVGDGLQPGSVAPGQPRRHDERAARRLVQVLDEVALAPLAGVHQQAGLDKLAHMVVDPLAGLAESPGHPRGRVRRPQGVEDPHPGRVGQRSQLLGVVDHGRSPSHARILDSHSVLDKCFFPESPTRQERQRRDPPSGGPSGMGSGENGRVGDAPVDGRPVGTVAFLFTDLGDSTAMWEAEPLAMRAAARRHVELIDEAAHRHAGVRAGDQGAGDSTVVAFDRVSDALGAALDVQLAFTAEGWPTTEPVRVRVALHVGEVHLGADGGYAGPTMNRCGRLIAAMHPGQVVASDAFVHLALEARSVSVDGDLSWIDLGAHQLRGIDAPMRIHQLAHPSLRSDFPPLRTPQALGATLPVPSTSLVGRREEIDALAALLAGHRAVTITGAGGSGKTRVAIETALQVLERFEDGAVWVDLAQVRDEDGVDEALVAALGAHHGPADMRRRWLNRIRSRQVLLVLDNCEHLTGRVAAAVAAAHAAGPGASVLATSREPLDVGGEVVWRLDPLGTPTEATEAGLLASDAGHLLVDRVRLVRPTAPLTGEDVQAAVEMCRRLDGIPLALELAAARSRSMPLPVIADRLDERLRLLAGGGRTTMARQRTLEASVAWSFDLLDNVERDVLVDLAVFEGQFDLEAARAVAGVAERDVEAALGRLVDQSMVAGSAAGRTAIYRLLETVRYFARARGVDAGTAGEARDRHLGWHRAQAASLEPQLVTSTANEALVRLDRQIVDVRAACEWALGTGRHRDVLEIVSPLLWYWVWRGATGEALALLDRADDALVEGDPVAAAAAWAALFLQTMHRADHERTEALGARAIRLARSVGDDPLEGRTIAYVGGHRSWFDPMATAGQIEDGHRRCLDGDPFWARYVETILTVPAWFRMRLEVVASQLPRLEEIARGTQSPQLLTEYHVRRCAAHRSLGNYEAVVSSVRELDAILAGITSRNMSGVAAWHAALGDVTRGRAAEVVERMAAMEAGYLEDEEHQHLPMIGLGGAAAHLALGRPGEALAAIERYWQHDIVRQQVPLGPYYRYFITLALLAVGRHGDARLVVDEALAEAERLQSPAAIAETNLPGGILDRSEQRHHAADGHLHAALDAFATLGYRQQVCDALEEIAALDVDFERPEPAAVLLGAAARERAAQGVVTRIGRQEAWVGTIAAARAALGDEPFDRAWQRGANLGLEDAVDYAKRGRGRRTRPGRGWDSLTATERKVAQLVAAGMTNPQIAEELLMGRETVKTHVSRILSKLALANRTQLAAAITERHMSR